MISTFRFRKTSFRSGHALLVAGTLAAATLVVVACNEGGFTDDNVPEGDRCNPLASHNECSSGLACTQATKPDGTGFGQGPGPIIPFCPENYCCSVDGNGNINSSNPNCQPGCNGGAAAICTAAPNSAACAFVMCTADASVASCLATSAGDAGTDGGGGDDSSPDSAGTNVDGSDGATGTMPEAGAPEAEAGSSPPEAGRDGDASEAATPMDSGGDVTGQ